MPFFVELPADEYGNRAYTNSYPCVIEADIVPDPYGDFPDGELLVSAPEEIAGKWERIPLKQYGGWLEVEGPARPLEWDERDRLIRNAPGPRTRPDQRRGQRRRRERGGVRDESNQR